MKAINIIRQGLMLSNKCLVNVFDRCGHRTVTWTTAIVALGKLLNINSCLWVLQYFCVLLTIGQGLGWPWVLTCNGVICNLQLARLGPTVCETKMSSAAESGLWSDSRFWMRTWKQRLIKKLILLPMGFCFLKVIHINKEHDVQWVCNQFALIWLDWHSALELCALCCQFIYNPYLFEGGLTHVQGWVGSSVVHENLQPAR